MYTLTMPQRNDLARVLLKAGMALHDWGHTQPESFGAQLYDELCVATAYLGPEFILEDKTPGTQFLTVKLSKGTGNMPYMWTRNGAIDLSALDIVLDGDYAYVQGVSAARGKILAKSGFRIWRRDLLQTAVDILEACGYTITPPEGEASPVVQVPVKVDLSGEPICPQCGAKGTIFADWSIFEATPARLWIDMSGAAIVDNTGTSSQDAEIESLHCQECNWEAQDGGYALDASAYIAAHKNETRRIEVVLHYDNQPDSLDWVDIPWLTPDSQITHELVLEAWQKQSDPDNPDGVVDVTVASIPERNFELDEEA